MPFGLFYAMPGGDNVYDEFEYNQEIFRKIGNRLKHYRKQMGYANYEKFAIAFNLPRATYGKHERGMNLTMASLIKYLRVMNVSFSDFFGEGFG